MQEKTISYKFQNGAILSTIKYILFLTTPFLAALRVESENVFIPSKLYICNICKKIISKKFQNGVILSKNKYRLLIRHFKGIFFYGNSIRSFNYSKDFTQKNIFPTNFNMVSYCQQIGIAFLTVILKVFANVKWKIFYLFKAE